MSIPTREEVYAAAAILGAAAQGGAPLAAATTHKYIIDADAALRDEITPLRAALLAAAEHHLEMATSRRGPVHYHAERARVLRAAAEVKA